MISEAAFRAFRSRVCLGAFDRLDRHEDTCPVSVLRLSWLNAVLASTPALLYWPGMRLNDAPLEGWRYCELRDLSPGSPVATAHAYWLAKCCAGQLPARKDIDPTEIPELLARSVLIDCIENDAYRIRLMGSDVRVNDGRDLTGKLVEQEHFGEAAAFFKDAFRRARDGRQSLFFRGRMIWESRYFKTFTQGVFPLETLPGAAPILFCVVDFDRPVVIV